MAYYRTTQQIELLHFFIFFCDMLHVLFYTSILRILIGLIKYKQILL